MFYFPLELLLSCECERASIPRVVGSSISWAYGERCLSFGMQVVWVHLRRRGGAKEGVATRLWR